MDLAPLCCVEPEAPILDTIQASDGLAGIIPYLFENVPCLLAGVSSDWTLNADSVKGLLAELSEAELAVPVDDASCTRRILPLREFLRRSLEQGERGLYAKDLHIDLEQRRRGAGPLYPVPFAFKDDWLNWYWHTCRAGEQPGDDYSFLYVGGPGSRTAVHHDVLLSYSWSVNIVGRKLWTLVPPHASAALFDGSSELVRDLRPGAFDEQRFPSLRACARLEVVQEQGTALFVPAGWYHQVDNLEDGGAEGLTVSVNRNWFNSFSLARVWRFLRGELLAVRAELVHFRRSVPPVSDMGLGVGRSQSTGTGMGEEEWLRHCETILRCNAALGLSDWLELVSARALMMHACFRRLRGCCCAAAGAVCGHQVQALGRALCPRYGDGRGGGDGGESDEELCRLLLDTRSPHLRRSRGAALPGEAKQVADPEDEDEEEWEGGGGEEPWSVFAFSCSEMLRALRAVRRCPEAMEHLGANVGEAEGQVPAMMSELSRLLDGLLQAATASES